MFRCNLSNIEIEQPVYVSKGDLSITSLSTFSKGKIEVYFSESIGHLITKPSLNSHSYYDTEYTISLDSDDDDQLYDFINEKQIYRLEHQANTLFDKIKLKDGANILDYGCAKGGVLKKLVNLKSSINPFLFDVSEMYIPFWEKFTLPYQWSTYETKPEWDNFFDVVTSFFVLEHVENPLQEVLKMRNLLKENGTLYFIVPNVYQNKADFILADHINHFSSRSIRYLLEKTGFELIDIDEDIHKAAFVVTARKKEETIDINLNSDFAYTTNEDVKEIVRFWEEIQTKILNFETSCNDKEVAIYGAGVYGTFITSCLKYRERVQYFIDQSAFLHGKEILGIPIIYPSELPESIQTVYVGLNPIYAKGNIGSIQVWQNRDNNYFFLG